MKLEVNALLELVEIFRLGVLEQKDVSQLLRELDLVENAGGRLELSPEYIELRDR